MWHLTGDRGRLPRVPAADDLDTVTLEPVEEGFQNRAGYRAYLVPDDHPGHELLPYPFGCPFCLATPAQEAVIGLGLDTQGLHFFRQAVGQGQDKGTPLAEELDGSRGLAGAPAAIQVAQVVPRQRVVVARSGAAEGLWLCQRTDVVRPGKVGRMLQAQANELVFVPLLARGDWGV